MLKESVLHVRDTLFKGNDLKIIADNMRKYNTKTDCIIWDDDKELCYVFRFNNNLASDQYKNPVTMDVFAYNEIQYLIRDMKIEETEEILTANEDLINASGMSKDKILDYFKSMIQTDITK